MEKYCGKNIVSQTSAHTNLSECTSSDFPYSVDVSKPTENGMTKLIRHSVNQKRVESKNRKSNSINLFKSNSKISKNAINIPGPPFACQNCSKTFPSLVSLQLHCDTHARKRRYVCEFCGIKLIHLHYLVSHVRLRHRNVEKNFVCEICGLECSVSKTLESHQQLCHSKFPCNICGMIFSHYSVLASHRRSRHYRRGSYACSECGKRFLSKVHLSFHSRTHRFVPAVHLIDPVLSPSASILPGEPLQSVQRAVQVQPVETAEDTTSPLAELQEFLQIKSSKVRNSNTAVPLSTEESEGQRGNVIDNTEGNNLSGDDVAESTVLLTKKAQGKSFLTVKIVTGNLIGEMDNRERLKLQTVQLAKELNSICTDWCSVPPNKLYSVIIGCDSSFSEVSTVVIIPCNELGGFITFLERKFTEKEVKACRKERNTQHKEVVGETAGKTAENDEDVDVEPPVFSDNFSDIEVSSFCTSIDAIERVDPLDEDDELDPTDSLDGLDLDALDGMDDLEDLDGLDWIDGIIGIDTTNETDEYSSWFQDEAEAFPEISSLL